MRTTSFLLCGAIALATVPSAMAAEKPVRENLQLDHMDVSKPLRDMKAIPPDWYEALADKDDHEVKRWPAHSPFIPPGTRPDPLAAHGLNKVTLASGTTITPHVAATAGLNFDGVGVPNYSVSGAPPDTVGAIGDTQYVQWVNQAFSVFNKTTGATVYGPVNGSTLWQGFGGRCETDNDGDPLVLWDKIAHRWVLSQFAVSASPYYQCIAVSTTADATGSYRRFSYSFGTAFNDYGKIGMWPDGYYITYNMFNNGQTWGGAKVCAYDRNQMLTASGTPGAQQCFQLSTTYGGLQPADMDGTTPPPAGTPNYVMAFDDVGNNGLNLWKFHVDWATPANTTFTGPTKITTATFSPACGGATCITQPGTTQQLDSLADRLMYRLVYRNMGSYESLLLNHSVDVSGHSGVRWYEIRTPGATPTVYQQGTFSPDSNHRWMGSIAQDKQGNIMIGYSTSGTVKPSVRYTGRLVTDTLGTMQAESEMFAGTGVQTGSSLSRWGDYSNLTVDPSDDCTFWFTTEYIKANGAFNWSTRVGSFKFPGCGGVATPDYTVGASPSSVSVVAGNSGTSTISVGSVNSFNAAVTLSASGLPSGATASFSVNPVTPPSNGSASSTLTLATSTGVASGTYGITITGTNGSTTRTASVSLTVTGQDQAAYDSTLKAPKCSAVGSTCDSGASLLNGRAALGPEPNQPNTINTSCADGTAGTFHSDESVDRLKVATTDGTAMAAGKTVNITTTMYAYSTTADTVDLYYAANANSPSWTLIGSFKPTATGVTSLVKPYTLPTGSLQAIRANFRYNGAAGSCTTGTYDDHDDLIFAVGAGSGDTTAPTTSITAPAGGSTVSGTTTISANASDNVAVTNVEFYVDGVLKGSDATSPYSFAWDTTTATNAAHSLTTKAYDAAGNVGTSAAVSVTVSNLATELIVNGGFEGSASPWTLATNFLWTNAGGAHGGTAYAHAGTTDNVNTTAYQQIAIPASATGTLTFWTYITTNETTTTTAYDKLIVEVRNTSGTVLATLATYSNLNKGTGWVQKSLSVAAYKGQTVRIYFHVTTDVSLTSDFRVDDVSVK